MIASGLRGNGPEFPEFPETTPSGKTTTYAYDGVGNVAGKTDANGDVITYVYDALDRLIETTYADGTSVTGMYDALGRRTAMTDQYGTTAYTYDALGRLLSVDGPDDRDMISYTYDAAGRRTGMLDQDSRKFVYDYDALHRLVSVSGPNGTTKYSYDALGNVVGVAYPNGAQTKTKYDLMNRPVKIANEAGHKLVSAFHYRYDEGGQVTRKAMEDGSVIAYSYDALDQLARETKRSSVGPYDYVYSYDAAGNR